MVKSFKTNISREENLGSCARHGGEYPYRWRNPTELAFPAIAPATGVDAIRAVFAFVANPGVTKMQDDVSRNAARRRIPQRI